MIDFEYRGTSKSGKTEVYDIRCNGMFLGEVKWYAPWRRYCFYPVAVSIFDFSCLKEIMEFISIKMNDRRCVA